MLCLVVCLFSMSVYCVPCLFPGECLRTVDRHIYCKCKMEFEDLFAKMAEMLVAHFPRLSGSSVSLCNGRILRQSLSCIFRLMFTGLGFCA